ncbi:type 1 fimbrial protein [Enterobacter sp. RIT418]|uniref:type 1 fimbrial protein n=1 Tax=Enterobacter sp. RIT418 TaxID=2202164 RepID=UPI000D4050CC|nr:type 1 fimbrial protein [Enterobacter sp. RIT 418]RAU38814.1 type 1 fimbrial protein [Enterobacter sp. RIT 418]
MATSFSRFLSGFTLLCSLSLTPAMAASEAQGGVIHFRGMIVEDPCVITSQHQQFDLTCPHNGRMQTQTINYRDVLNGHQSPSSAVEVSMKYLDQQKKLAVVLVNYR